MNAIGDMINLLPNSNIRPIDDVLQEIFERYKMTRLGGSSGRGWSSYSTFQRCPYLYKVTYIDGERGIPAKALEIGSAFHTFMALHYTWMLDANLALTPHVCREELMNGGARPESIIEAWRVYDSYAMHYEVDYLYPLGIEEWAQGDNGNTCRYDLIARIDEPQPGVVPGTYIVEHKCLESSEKIQDQATGKLWTVQDLHARCIAPLVLGFDTITGKLVRVQADVPQPTNVRDVYKTVLRSGRHLCTSENHPFLTARGWIPAVELTKNDWVAIPKTTGGYYGPSPFSDIEVEFVGFMLGDGTMTTNTFTKSDGPTLKRFLTVIEALGYHEGGGDSAAYRIQRDTCRAPEVRLSQAQESVARVLLERLNLWGHLAATKFIPDELLAVPDHQVYIMLSALWNIDGCIDTFEEHYKDGIRQPQTKVRIAYVSRAQTLCDGIQQLLLRIGIPSTVTESSVEYEGERRDVWTTKVVTREGKRHFLMLIKEGRINFLNYPIDEAFLAIKSGDDAPIPAALIRQLVPDDELTGILRQQVKLNHSVQRGFLAEQGIKKQSKAIEKLLDSDLTWERVSYVVVNGRAMMYDITVPGIHNFVANGIITHNTAARFTIDLLEGWHNDGEVLGQIMVWKQGKLDKKYGKLRGTIVNIAGKQKTPQFQRVIVPAQAWHVREHAQDLKIWAAYQEMCRATDTWPRARNNCVGRFGLCQLFTHCSTNDKLTPLRRIKKAMAEAIQPSITGTPVSSTELVESGNHQSTPEPVGAEGDASESLPTEDSPETTTSEN